MKEKIKSVMAAVFELPVDQIDDDASPDNIESWDSLKHMNLVVALEEEFDIKFDYNEITEMLNLKLIQRIIEDK
jgi:acyl carrier protein